MGWKWGRWVWGVLAWAGLLGCGGAVEGGVGTGLAPTALEAREQASHREKEGAPRWYWFATGVVGEEDHLFSVAHDRKGNIVAVGGFGRGLLLGSKGERIEGRGPRTALVVKFSPEGRMLWYRAFDTEAAGGPATGFAGAIAVAVDRRGNIIFSGAHTGTMDLGGGPLTTGGFLAKLDPAGRHLWSRAVPVDGSFPLGELVTDRDDDILVAGSSGDGTGLLVKLSPEGVERWRLMDPLPRVGFRGLTVDEEENVYVGGGDFNFGGSPFLMKVSPRGEPRWSRTLRTPMGSIRSIAVSGDRVVVTGNFRGSLSFGGRTFSVEEGGVAGYLAAFTRQGRERWARKMGRGEGSLVAADGCGGVVTAGSYLPGDDLGRGPEAGLPGSLYAARVDRHDGDVRWVRTFPTEASIHLDLSAARDGSSTLVGAFIYPIDFGDGPVVPEPVQDDMFILNLSP